MKTETIRLYAIAKLDWIKQHQRKITVQERETPREYLDRESHYVWGRRFLLRVVEADGPASVEQEHKSLLLRMRPGANAEEKQAVLDEWYRKEVRTAAQPLIEKWQRLMNVSVARCYVQRMKTKWGSCNDSTRSIRLNSELAKKPPRCLEYVVVHEMAHLLEPTHSRRFVKLMNAYLPDWQHRRAELNQLPVRHESWR